MSGEVVKIWLISSLWYKYEYGNETPMTCYTRKEPGRWYADMFKQFGKDNRITIIYSSEFFCLEPEATELIEKTS